MTIATGEAILFTPTAATRKPNRKGTFVRSLPGGQVEVKLDGDPFSVRVKSKQVTTSIESVETEGDQNMPTTTDTKPTAKELRRQAKSLDIEGWEEMSLAELRAAVAGAEKASGSAKKSTTAKKTTGRAKAAPVEEVEDEDLDDEEDGEDEEVEEAPKPRKRTTAKAAAPAKKATKAAAKPASKAKVKDEDVEEAVENENGNPFREGTNLYLIAEEVIKGGKRTAIVKKLKRKIDLKPRQRAGADYDEDAEIDRRILIVGQILAKEHGFNVVKDGRGPDAHIVAERP